MTKNHSIPSEPMNSNSHVVTLPVGDWPAGGPISAQGAKDPEWVKQSPTIGEAFPDLTVHTADGKDSKRRAAALLP